MESGVGKAFLEMEIDRESPQKGRDILITDDHADRRVDRICRTLYKHIPLGAIMRSIRKGEVRLDGRRTKPDARPFLGQTLRVPWEELPENPGKKGSRKSDNSLVDKNSLRIVYEDADLLVVDKPWGLLSQPDVKGGDSLVTRIWEMVPPRQDFRAVPVHRLDRNTSGLLLVALGGSLLRELHVLWREGKIVKRYWALVAGTPKEVGEIRAPLRKEEKENRVYVDSRGEAALTRYRVLSRHGEYSLLEVELCTGRSHQIRVHLAHEGFPLVGDYKYGNPGVNKKVREQGISRPLLHAQSIEFPSMLSPWEHLSKQIFSCPPPSDFTYFLSRK